MHRRRQPRSGIAAVEFAVCLPLLLALVYGVIESSNAVFVQQALTSGAYEAANVVSASGGNSTAAESRANAVLSDLGINSATTSISPIVTAATPAGTTIVITCTAPLSANSKLFGFIGSPTMTAKFTTVRL